MQGARKVAPRAGISGQGIGNSLEMQHRRSRFSAMRANPPERGMRPGMAGLALERGFKGFNRARLVVGRDQTTAELVPGHGRAGRRTLAGNSHRTRGITRGKRRAALGNEIRAIAHRRHRL